MNIDTKSLIPHNWPSPISKPCATVKADEPAAHKRHDPEDDFYHREESPWLPRTASGEVHEDFKHLSPVQVEAIKESYLDGVLGKFNTSMYRVFDRFHDFKQQLSYLNPDLSNKFFGFTLGEDQKIQVTDPDGVLMPAEKSYLTEQLNNRSRFQEEVRTHAKLLMTLVDHDRKNFPDRYVLDLENYSQIIDYGQLFSRNSIGNFLQTLNYQLERNAEKIEEEPEPLVDVHA